MPIDCRSDITMALLDGVEGKEFKAEWMREGEFQSSATNFEVIQPSLENTEKVFENIARKMEIQIESFEEPFLSKDAIVYRFRKAKAGSADNSASSAEANQNMRLDVSPNPTSGQVKIDFFVPDAKQITLTVRDLGGKEILSRVFEGKSISQSVSLNLENESKGAYFVSLDWDGGKLVKKIITRD